MYSKVIKRVFDIFFSVLLLFCIVPILLMIIVILSIANKGTPFFVQPRPGRDEKIFHVIKFKTMNDATDDEGRLLSDTERLTWMGKIVRKTSVDELPQLINVLKGDMSFIGPRPLLIRYLPYYTEDEKRRHSIRPGITGLAQVSGRNLLKWDERLAKDIEYVDTISFMLDVKILIQTIKNVITSKDIVVDPSALMLDLDEYRKN